MRSTNAAAHQRPGHPPLDRDEYAVRMHITLRPYHRIVLVALAAEQGMPVSRLLRDIIDDWLWQVMGEEPMPRPTELTDGEGKENLP
jgi:hypothetical protein